MLADYKFPGDKDENEEKRACGLRLDKTLNGIEFGVLHYCVSHILLSHRRKEQAALRATQLFSSWSIMIYTFPQRGSQQI